MRMIDGLTWASRIVLCGLILAGALLQTRPADAGLSCNEAMSPECSGFGCPPDQSCQFVNGACECAPLPCGDSQFPACEGRCPDGQTCQFSGQVCECMVLGCCVFGNSNATTSGLLSCSGGTAQQCEQEELGIFFPGEVCVDGTSCAAPTPTDTPTATATSTATSSATATRTATVTTTATPSATQTAQVIATSTRVPDGGSCMTSADCQSLKCVDGICDPNLSPAPAASPFGLAIGLATLAGLGMWRLRHLRR